MTAETIPQTGREPLDAVLEEIALADDLAFTPDDEIKPGETVVGEVPPWLRKVYALKMYYGREAAVMKAQMPYVNDAEERNKLTTAWYKADDNEDLLSEIFWVSCWRVLEPTTPRLPGVTLGVRKDWKLVTSTPKNHLAEMLGLGRI